VRSTKDYSGPGSLADIEAAHAMSDEEDRCNDHWPPLESRSCHELAPDVAGPDHRPRLPPPPSALWSMIQIPRAHPRLLLLRHSSVVKLLLITVRQTTLYLALHLKLCRP